METAKIELSNKSSEGTINDLEQVVKKIGFWIGAFALIFLLITLFTYFYYFNGEVLKQHDKWGMFGDYIGGTLSPIFSLLSLIAILVTLLFQAKDLSSSSIALKEQAEYTRLQAFESTFFSMVMMHNENLKGLDLDETEADKYYGRSIFRIMHRRFKDSYNDSDGSNELLKIKEAYIKFYNKNNRFIGHYLRTLNQIFQFVFESTVENKVKYLQFIKAQLSEYELMIIFYHSMVYESFVGFNVLKEKGIFQDFVYETLVNIETHKAYLVEGDKNV